MTHPPRIGLFTYGMGERLTGIGRYAVELSRALVRVRPDAQVVLLNPYPDSELPWYGEFETYSLPQLRLVPAAATLGHGQLARAARRLNLDVLHDPCGIAPFLAPRGPGRPYRRVVTVHDAIPLHYPQVQPLATRLIFNTLIRLAGRSADAVLTVSQASARDLREHLHIPAGKLFVTPLGAHPAPPPDPEGVQGALARHGLRAPYLLYVGALDPRKNLDRVLGAFATVHGVYPEAQLAVVGAARPSSQQVGTVARARNQAGVVLTGFVTDTDLAALYAGALGFVFPSLYEGFGLPVLEAMACGTPVITSNTSSLPEVAGDAALLVQPDRVDEIAAAMLRLLGNPALRADLGARGRARAALFSWDETARLTLRAYGVE